MKKAEPFYGQLHSLAGDDPRAEPTLWFSSVILGILACKIVYNVMKTLSPSCFNGYTKLTDLQKVEWDNRGFSTFHAITVSTAAAYFLFISDFFDNHGPIGVVFCSSIMSQMTLGVSIGYFISDLAMILWFYPALGGEEYVLHHLLSIISMSLSLYSGHAHFYIYIVLFSEVTTPFVNLRWYLNVVGMKTSKAYAINGIFLFFGWLIARVILFAYFFIHIYLHYDQVREIFPIGYYCLFIVPPSLAMMNLFWFYKILRGLLRLVLKRD